MFSTSSRALGVVQRLDVLVIDLLQNVDDQADIFVLVFGVLLRGTEGNGKADETGAENTQQPDEVPARHEQPSSCKRSGDPRATRGHYNR